jgi:hypothetical protein
MTGKRPPPVVPASCVLACRGYHQGRRRYFKITLSEDAISILYQVCAMCSATLRTQRTSHQTSDGPSPIAKSDTQTWNVSSNRGHGPSFLRGEDTEGVAWRCTNLRNFCWAQCYYVKHAYRRSLLQASWTAFAVFIKKTGIRAARSWAEPSFVDVPFSRYTWSRPSGVGVASKKAAIA